MLTTSAPIEPQETLHSTFSTKVITFAGTARAVSYMTSIVIDFFATPSVLFTTATGTFVAVACPFNAMLQVTFFNFIRISTLAHTRTSANIMKLSRTARTGAFPSLFPRTPLWQTHLRVAKFSLRWFSTAWIRWTVPISSSIPTTTCYCAIGPLTP